MSKILDNIKITGTGTGAALEVAGGHIGIGTSSPLFDFDVAYSSSSANPTLYPFVVTRNTNATLGNGTSTFNQSGFGVGAGNGVVGGALNAEYVTDGAVYYPSVNLVTSTNHPLRFFTYTNSGGIGAMQINADGKVAIGPGFACTSATSATAALHVQGPGNDSSTYAFKSQTASALSIFSIRNDAKSFMQNGSFYIIGTTATTAIKGSAAVDAANDYFYLGPNSADSGLLILRETGALKVQINATTGGANFFDNGAGLSIGAQNPAINHNAQLDITISGSENWIHFQDTASYPMATIGMEGIFWKLQHLQPGYGIKMGVDGYSDLFTLATSGGVGINNTLPTAKLHVVGTGATSATDTIAFHNSSGTNNALVISDDGGVGIGTTNDESVTGLKVVINGGIRRGLTVTSSSLGAIVGTTTAAEGAIVGFGNNNSAAGIIGTSSVGGTGGYFSSVSGKAVTVHSQTDQALYVEQQNFAITGSNSAETVSIERNTVLGGFDMTGALLKIHSTIADTGHLLQITKQTIDKFIIKSTGVLQYLDGNQGSGKILTSDSSGNASWQPQAKNIILTGAGGWGSSTNGASGPNQTEIGTNLINIQTLDFVQATQSYAEWTATLPDNYTGGTITASFYWTANSTSTNSVVWGLQSRAFGNDITIDQAFGTAQEVTDANTATANQVHISNATSAITIAGTPTAGQLIQFRAYRLGSGSDNLAATANLMSVKIIYT